MLPFRARRFAAFLVLTILALPWALVHEAGAMPPPARGNTKGLPAAVRQALAEDPTLFYPKRGFRSTIEQMKARRTTLVREAMRRGLSAPEADRSALGQMQSQATVRYCPVLCGIYADKPSPDWPTADLVDQLFSLDYGATNPFGDTGSMREHYRDMSFGTFDVQGGVFGWFPVPENGIYYYADSNGLTTDADSGQAGAFIRHTLQASDATVDFRPYDNDGPDGVPNSGDDDGIVDLVMFVHPNQGGECGESDIWSHSFSYSGWGQHDGQMFVTDDLGANGQPLKVDDYVIMPALACGGARRIEIGVFSHEFGHALGLPDLYDRTAADPLSLARTGGMGLYCLMAAGSYGGDYDHPATPTQMCAWSKEELGFLTPHEIVCDESRELYAMDDAPEAVKLWRGGDYSQDEWFLVENRQRVKWDQYMLGTGFLVTHVDNNVLTQNDESCPGGNPCPAGHYLVMTIEADNQWEMQGTAPPILGPWFGEAADFFHAATVDSLTDFTGPSSRDHTGTPTGVSVTRISASGRKMTADFSVGQTCATAPDLAVVSSRVSGGCDLDPFVDPDEEVDLQVTLRNFPTAAPATNVTATLTSLTPSRVVVTQPNAAFADLGRGRYGSTIVPFRVKGTASAPCSTTATLRLDVTAAGGYVAQRTFTVRLALDSLYVPFASFTDDVESGGDNGWKHYAYVNEDDWARSTNGNHTVGAVPGTSWFTAAPPTGKDVSLEPPAFVPGPTSVLSYWHRYDTEDDWDGCLLELSTDGGATWIDVGDQTNIGYDDPVTVNPQSTISGRRCWNGTNAGFPQFEQVTLALAPWAGQICLIRFRLATDLASTGVTPLTGLNIDDLSIHDAGVLRERCEATPACGAPESVPPVFAGLDEAINPGTPACDAADLKWLAATDASPPVTYLVYASSSPTGPLSGPIASTTALRHRVTGLGPGQTWRFAVRARDSQGNVESNTVERTLVLDCEPPNLLVDGVTLVEAGGCDGDDLPDGGEALDLAVRLRNAGRSNATNVTASLRVVSGPVSVPLGTASWPDLPLGHFEESALPFRIYVDPEATCGAGAVLKLVVHADGGYEETRTIPLVLEQDAGETCDATAACQTIAVDPPASGSGTFFAGGVPNPAVGAMRFDFGLSSADAGPVTLRIFDLAGRVVRTLVDGTLPPGSHRTVWDRTNDRGERVAAGVYFSQLTTVTRTLERKVMYVR